jgi:membrane protein YdbS with pleckstrin-like domain
MVPPQLHVVAEPAEPQATPLATFRADARLRLWGAAACALLAIAFTALGYRHAVAPLVAGPLAAAFLLWAAYLLATFAARRSVRYTLSAQRLEIESGVLGKRFESVELWRVRDVVLEQTFVERLRGVGRITVYSSDQVEPVLGLGPLASAKPLFDRLRDAVAAARKVARVVPLDPGR